MKNGIRGLRMGMSGPELEGPGSEEMKMFLAELTIVQKEDGRRVDEFARS